MPEITDQIQHLIEQGQTEQALETLASWLRTQQTSALNEVILLRARYEEVQRDLGMNLISPEEAARSYSQINFALLNLLQNIKNPIPQAAATTPNRRGWLIAGAGALLLLVLIMFVFKILFPSRELSNSTTEDVKSNVTSASNIHFPNGKEATLQELDTKVTYTVLEGRAEPYNPENQKITLTIRCFLGKGIGGMNFWESSFRLIVKDLPYAAQGGLNELVENESYKDGEVYFLIPKDARAADLKMTFLDQYTTLPLQW